MTGQHQSTAGDHHSGDGRPGTQPAGTTRRTTPEIIKAGDDRLLIGIGSYDRHPAHRRQRRTARGRQDVLGPGS